MLFDAFLTTTLVRLIFAMSAGASIQMRLTQVMLDINLANNVKKKKNQSELCLSHISYVGKQP